MLINFSMMPNEKHTQTLRTRGFESNTWFPLTKSTLSVSDTASLLLPPVYPFPFLFPVPQGKGRCRHWITLWGPRKETPRCFSVLWHLQLWDGGLLDGYIDGWLFWSSLMLERRKDDSLGDTSQDQREQRWQ